jgi:hypothetical protein
LKALKEKQPKLNKEYLKEILLTNYYYAKQKESLDTIETTIINTLEDDGKSLEECLQIMSQNPDLLEELLKRYLETETQKEYPLSYTDKLEKSPKVKIKLYPKGTSGRG